MKHFYFLVLFFCLSFVNAQTCPETAFANGSNLFFNDTGNNIDCGSLSSTITVEGVTYTRSSCDTNSMIYSTTDTPINDNIPFSVDFGGGLVCSYDASGTLPVEEFILKNTLKVFPNPIQNGNTLKISIASPLVGKIELYSVTGKLQRSMELGKTTNSFDISNLNNGIYLLKISTDSALVTRKVVIMK